MTDVESIQLAQAERTARFIYERLSRPEVASHYPNLRATAKELWHETIAALRASQTYH